MRTFLNYLTSLLAAAAVISGCGKSDIPDTPDIPPEPEQPTVKAYSVGDYYQKGFVMGVVVSVDEKGEHGLIVSLKEHEAAWAFRSDNVMDGQPGTGQYNTGRVREFKDWMDFYPAFERATLENVGALKDWFLPSMHELASLYKAYTGHDTNDVEQGAGSTKAGMSENESKDWFNKCLAGNKGTAISDQVYWSSNELGPSIASAFDMRTGTSLDVPSDLDKRKVYKVRAMASF